MFDINIIRIWCTPDRHSGVALECGRTITFANGDTGSYVFSFFGHRYRRRFCILFMERTIVANQETYIPKWTYESHVIKSVRDNGAGAAAAVALWNDLIDTPPALFSSRLGMIRNTNKAINKLLDFGPVRPRRRPLRFGEETPPERSTTREQTEHAKGNIAKETVPKRKRKKTSGDHQYYTTLRYHISCQHYGLNYLYL